MNPQDYGNPKIQGAILQVRRPSFRERWGPTIAAAVGAFAGAIIGTSTWVILLAMSCAPSSTAPAPDPPAAFRHDAVVTWAEYQIVHDIELDVRLAIAPAIELEEGRSYEAWAMVGVHEWRHRITTEPGRRDTVTCLGIWNERIPAPGDSIHFRTIE